MLRKLDNITQSDWEMSREISPVQSLSHLTAFLEKKIQALRNRPAASTEQKHVTNGGHSGSNKRHHGNRASYEHKGKRFKRDKDSNFKHKSENQLEKPICVLCEGRRHFLWQCPKFRAMALAERVQRVESWKVCPCCLIKKHPSDACESSGCARCEGTKHNNMMCPRYTVFNANHVRKGHNQNGRRSNKKE